MATATTTKIVNGIDVEALQGTIHAVSADPAPGMTTWRVATRWLGGTRSDTHVDHYEIGGQRIDKDWTIKVDEPLEIGGTNQYANPQEYLLAAMNACMMVGYVAVSSLLGVELESVRIETQGEIDLRGFLGVDKKVAPGYETLKQTVYIKGNGTPEQFRKIHEMAWATSPNRHNITTAVALDTDLVIE
jgi:uncharacterized OsmC-like protein